MSSGGWILNILVHLDMLIKNKKRKKERKKNRYIHFSLLYVKKPRYIHFSLLNVKKHKQKTTTERQKWITEKNAHKSGIKSAVKPY